MSQSRFHLRRVYDWLAESGRRKAFLVDRLWPRGISKEQLKSVRWLREVSPSDELRREFNHDPDRWPEFLQRYHAQLDQHPESWAPLMAAAEAGEVTLLYAAKNEEHNNAVALRLYLEDQLHR